MRSEYQSRSSVDYQGGIATRVSQRRRRTNAWRSSGTEIASPTRYARHVPESVVGWEVPPGATPNLPPPRDAAEGTFGPRDFLESVIGPDDRSRIDDPDKNPYRWICALHIHCKDGANFLGTGFLIGERTVITAGHCVYIALHEGWAESIDVIPALNGTGEPYGELQSSTFHAPDGWVSEADTNVDYGAIVLDDSIGKRTGYFGFGALSDDEITTYEATISGYPADLDRGTKQYSHSRNINEVTPRRLFYEIDTFGGDSGAPVFVDMNGKKVVVGIHTTGSSRTNSGTRINDDVLANLKQWRQ
jgi:glutamyl endopeptidase